MTLVSDTVRPAHAVRRVGGHGSFPQRYAGRAIAALASIALRDEVELDAVRADLLGAVGETVRPAHASVWLRDRVR